MEITVVTFVEEQMSSWKGNLLKLPIIIKYSAIGTRKYSESKVEGDGEVRVMTRGFGDLVAKLGDKVVVEVLVRCWSDGDVVPTSVPSASLTQRIWSNISMVFSWGSSIGPEGFLPSILLLVVIIVVVVIVVVTVILVVVVVEVDLTGDEDPTNEDRDIGMGYSIGVSVCLGGGISSGGKKSQDSNIGDSGNTGDGGTIVRGGIVTCGGLMASYACMTFI
ncbi:hypothetical protein Tco_0494603 [Tanacetum coccineum]